jgi:flagellin
MRDLSVQAANATLSDADRANINKEVQALYTNINNIASRTQFNGQNLLTGALSTSQDTAASTLLVGAIATTAGAATISNIDLSRADAGATGTSAYNITSDSAAGTLTLTHSSTVGGVQHTASQTVSVGATAAGATQTIDFSTLGVKFTVTGGTASTSAAAVIAAVDGTHVDTTAGTAVAAFQVGADANQTESAAFFDTRISSTNDNAALNTAIVNFGSASTVVNSNALNSAIDGMISTLVSKRASLGASQNSLQHTMNNLKTASDNLSASNSRIRDVDVAAESSAMTRAQIISQSAVSVLAQANQMPQLALKLLG